MDFVLGGLPNVETNATDTPTIPICPVVCPSQLQIGMRPSWMLWPVENLPFISAQRLLPRISERHWFSRRKDGAVQRCAAEGACVVKVFSGAASHEVFLAVGRGHNPGQVLLLEHPVEGVCCHLAEGHSNMFVCV